MDSKMKRDSSKFNISFSSNIRKKGQVTIFVVLGIIVVVGILVAIFLRQDLARVFGKEIEPSEEIRSCVEEALEPVMNLVLENAGELAPELMKMYNGSRYNYLCYQSGDYTPCINTHPMIKKTAENSLMDATRSQVEQCFVDMIEELEARGDTVTEGDLYYSLELVPGNLLVKIEKEITITGKDTTQSFEDFSFEILTQMYGLFNLAREVVNQESQFCYFDYNGFMTLYPEYKIKKISYDDTWIYTAFHEKTNEKIKFAIRGCTFPAGI
jgi:hypothetical protein